MAPHLNGSKVAGLVAGPQQHDGGSMARRLAGSRARQLDRRRLDGWTARQLHSSMVAGGTAISSMARQLTDRRFNGSSAWWLDG